MKTVRILTKALLVMVLLLLLTQKAFGPGGPAGSPNNPIQLNNVNFMDIELGLDKFYILTEDIDLGCEWRTTAVIAPDTQPGYVFEGTAFTGGLDGRDENGVDHVIRGLCIDTQGANNHWLGLFGMLDGAVIKNLRLEDVSIIGGNLSQYTGALAGQTTSTTIIQNCSSSGTLTKGGSIFDDIESAIGGLIGWNGGLIESCYSECTVTAGPKASRVGGLAGYNGGDIFCSYATGNVNAGADPSYHGGHFVGGLIGYNSDSSTAISNCYAIGNVSGEAYVGGLVGSNHFSTIENCYAKGSVTAPYGSGLVHEIFYCSITNCYSTGYVSGTYNDSSGCIGAIGGGPVYVTNCFWDTQTSGMTQSVLGTGLTTLEMQTEATFTTAGWDFTDTWMIIEEGATYPELTCVPETPCSDMHVNSIDMTVEIKQPAGPRANIASATITIMDCYDNTIEGVSVAIKWSGTVPTTYDDDTTDDQGQVTFSIADGDNTGGDFVILITDVDKTGWTWDEDASVITASILNPDNP